MIAMWRRIAKYVFFFASPLYFLVHFTGTGCNSIPNNLVITDTLFNRFDENLIYRMENFHLFNTKAFGQAVAFCGVNLCSVRVNGTPDSPSHDSIYARIACRKDTILQINDSMYGLPAFVESDITSWNMCGHHFSNHESTFLGKLFRASIDSSLFFAIRACLDTLRGLSVVPPPEYASTVVTALNTAVADVGFFKKHKEELLVAVIAEKLNHRLDRLIAEGVFIDSSYTPKSPLTPYEKASIQWFNMDLFSLKHVDFMSGEEKSSMLGLFLSSQRIFRIDFSMGPDSNNLSAEGMTRFFSFNKSGASQIAFQEYTGGLKTIPNGFGEKRFLPFPYMTGTSWSVTPLFMGELPLVPADKRSLLVRPGRAFSYYDQNASSSNIARYSLTLYYPINGAYNENGLRYTCIGSIVITFKYSRPMTVPYDPATITDWNTEVFVRRSDSDGTIHEKKTVTLLHAVVKN
ncbi:MAG: hypothetical protein JXA71_09845 [Chitinispirillaceae bacterium]|nr:hypothetical protein [Chitinispirillaceae bacterium]